MSVCSRNNDCVDLTKHRLTFFIIFGHQVLYEGNSSQGQGCIMCLVLAVNLL